MFGHQGDKSDKQDSNDIPDESIQAAIEPQDQPDNSTPGAPSFPANGQSDGDWQHPGKPIDDSGSSDSKSSDAPIDVISPAGGYPRSTTSQVSTSGPSSHSSDNDSSPTEPAFSIDNNAKGGDLSDIKQHALEELSPLVDKLDQTPEEKFRTLMMLIQASDDQSLVDKAYKAAHSIEDEKIRAQALLDIVNEINYFTQQPAAD